MEQTLDALAGGQRAYITGVDNSTGMARRLEELGLLPGTRVICELVASGGDPVAYRVRGALIALRRRDARSVHVSLCGEGEG